MNSGTKNSSGGGPDGSGGRPHSHRTTVLSDKRVAREAGITTVGFLVLAIFVGMFAFAAIRLTPVYLNYMKVAGVVNGVLEEFDGQNPSRAEIRNSISRRFEVEAVSEIDSRDVRIITDNNGFVVEADYQHTAPYIGNIYFTVKFNKRVLVRR